MKNWLERADNWIDKHRPWTLLSTVITTLTLIAVVDWLTKSQLVERFFYPAFCNPRTPTKCDPIEWKELFQAGVLLLGLPVAFWLWHWRDRNVRDQIDNTRKDLNLREFNEIQVRLAGAIDESISEKSRIALQTIALFQMSAFLSGDRGHSFSRAAFEAIRAKFSGDFTELFREKFKREIQEVEQIYDKMIHGRFPKYRRIFMLTASFRQNLWDIRKLYQKDPGKIVNRRFFLENFEELF